ncbi:MAG: hypothetical protein V4649_13850 [Bacteroidota bacterium]
MKIIYSLIFLAFTATAQAQDFCKQVLKEMSEDKTQIDYSSPLNTQHLTPVVVKRTINTNPEWAVDNFTVLFQMTGEIESIYGKNTDGSQKEKEEKKLVVYFDDNSKLVDDTVVVTHDFTDDRTMAIRNIYYPVSEDAAKSFTSKKIVKFSLADAERTVPADSANAIMHYFQCIKTGK